MPRFEPLTEVASGQYDVRGDLAYSRARVENISLWIEPERWRGPRRNVGMIDRAAALEEMIGEYQEERRVAASRLNESRLQRAKLELAREVMVEHGENAEADRLSIEIHDLDNKIRVGEEVLTRLERLTALFQKSLDEIREGSKTP